MSESATQVMEKPIPPSEKSITASESANAKKEEPVKSEDNILSQEEIASLEKKEDDIKGGFFGKIFNHSLRSDGNKPGDATAKPQYTNNSPETEIGRLEKDLSVATSRIESISMSVEKIEGKLESERAVSSGIEERISHLTEEIGELRSMILDRERGFNEIETSFKKIEAMTEEIQPQNIKKDLDRKEREIIDITVKIERLEAVSSETNKQIKLFREQMDKIRSLDNILKVSKDIEENITKIKETEKYTDRMAAKTEELFTELDKRLSQFVSHTARIESLDELTRDLMKSQDKNEIKLKEAVFKEDLEKLKNSVISSVNENIKKEISGDNSNLGKRLEEAYKSATEAKEIISKISDDEKNKDQELSNIKTILKSFDTQLKDLKSQSEIQNIETQKKIEHISTSSSADKTQAQATSSNKSEDLPEIFNMISEKKIKEVRKEIEDISNTMKYLNTSISDLRKNNLAQMNNIMDIKRYQDSLPNAIENNIREKTKTLEADIAQITELLTLIQKNKNSEKIEINELKDEFDKKIEATRESISNIEKNEKLRFNLIDEKNTSKNNDLELVKKELSSLDSKMRKELELTRKDDEMSRAELEKMLKKETARLENLDKDIRQISDAVADLKDNQGYMRESIDGSQAENDNLTSVIEAKIREKTDELKKELAEIDSVKKEIETIRSAKDYTKKERDIDSSKICHLTKKIDKISKSLADLKDNMNYMKDSIDSTQLENDSIKTVIDKKIIKSREELKKDIDAAMTEKDASMYKLEKDSSRVEELNQKIAQISSTVANLKDKTVKMEDRIDSSLKENKTAKSAVDALNSDDAKTYDARKDTSSTYRRPVNMPDEVLLERIQKDILHPEENPIINSHNQPDGFGVPENISQETLQPDEYDLRLNKIIRLINKTEEFLKKNNQEDAEKSYGTLKAAYNTVYTKVPKNQIEEIRPKIDRLENILGKR